MDLRERDVSLGRKGGTSDASGTWSELATIYTFITPYHILVHISILQIARTLGSI
jgi:hypothetical protein